MQNPSAMRTGLFFFSYCFVSEYCCVLLSFLRVLDNNGQQFGKSMFCLHCFDCRCLHTTDHASCHSLAITVPSSAPEREQQSRDGRWSILQETHSCGNFMSLAVVARAASRAGLRPSIQRALHLSRKQCCETKNVLLATTCLLWRHVYLGRPARFAFLRNTWKLDQSSIDEEKL